MIQRALNKSDLRDKKHKKTPINWSIYLNSNNAIEWKEDFDEIQWNEYMTKWILKQNSRKFVRKINVQKKGISLSISIRSIYIYFNTIQYERNTQMDKKLIYKFKWPTEKVYFPAHLLFFKDTRCIILG